jgi:flagellar M-ring protein FliF
MDVLNTAFAQIADLFKSMTPGARLTAGLLLVVVVVSLAYLFNHQLAGGDADLLGGQPFTAGEMSAMEAAFGKAGLNGYTIVGSRIRVPAGQKAAYMAALVDHGALPAHFGDYLTNAMSKVGPFSSRQQQEELLKIAKQQELASIILSMDGIEKASVQYDVQKKTGFRQNLLASASVSVKRHGMLALEERQVPMIRHLVAGAFAGLAPDDVSVIDLNGRTYSRRSGEGLGSASEDPFVTRMKEYQAMYEAQIHNALSYVPGVTVTANVELNKELSTKQEKDMFDPKQVAVLRSVEESTTNTTEPANAGGGRPGLEAQGPNQPARLAGASGGTKSSEDHSSTEVQNAPSHDRTLTELAGLTPRRVSAVIGVPTTYFEQVWRQRNPTPAGEAPKTPDKGALDVIQKEETEKLRTFVTNLLPQPTTPAEYPLPQVTVTSFSHVITETDPGPPLVDKAVAWLGNYWTTLGTIGLVLMSLLMIRSLISAPVAVASDLPSILPQAVASTPVETGSAAPDDGQKSKSRWRRKLGAGSNMREELAEIVREDPDTAANILRGWIGSAS